MTEPAVVKVVDRLQATVQTIEKTFSTTASTLTTQLTSSIATMNAMNDVMERFLQTSIGVESIVVGSCVTIIVSSRSPLPIPNACLELRLEPEEPFAIDGSDSETTHTVSLPNAGIINPAQPVRTTLTVGGIGLHQRNMLVQVVFSSPATQKTLHSATHTLGLYIIDRLERSYVPSAGYPAAAVVGEAEELQVGIASFRRFFNIHPAAGIVAGDVAVLVDGDRQSWSFLVQGITGLDKLTLKVLSAKPSEHDDGLLTTTILQEMRVVLKI